MGEYEIGKEVATLNIDVADLRNKVNVLWALVEHNIKIGKIEEPKEEGKKK